ncbi:glycosyltransferase [Microbacterium sp.]|uniref:glycosyltransferase n=1 Tax=Microbacterium sp. TaxID=51671 RepID=UPI0028117B9A|nr:glycosyltransferase [Microbacterium sp.]
MHRGNDESRPQGLPARGHVKRLLRDPETAINKYVGLLARSQRWERERQGLNRKLADAQGKARSASAARKAVEVLEGEVRQLRSELDSAAAENRQLRADLKRIRGSRAMMIGRGVLAPARVARRLVQRDNASSPADVGGTTGSAESPNPDERALGRHSDQALAAGQSAALTPPAVTTAELLEQLEKEPSPDSLRRVLNALWFTEGEISRPAALLARYADLVDLAQGPVQHLAEQIRSASYLFEHGYAVPPRAAGTALRTEPGRVMYCAHSTPVYGTNGYSVRTGGVAQGLAANGADVFVVARAGYPWDSGFQGPRVRTAVERGGIEYVHHPGTSLSEASAVEAIDEAADAFLREARRQRPEVVHAASNYLTALPALITARRLGLPFVYEVRGLWELSAASTRPGWDETERYALQVRLENLVMREADQVLAITRQVADVLEIRGVDPQRIAILPNAVDSRGQLPLPIDEEYASSLGIERDVPWIGFAGSMVPYEGLDVLLDAAALLRRYGRAFRVVLAGSGSHEAELRRRASDLGLADIVHFIGRRPHEEIPRLISLFDVMPCPRVDQPVTRLVSPLKPIEAFANGKAVVLSDLPPHRDLAGDSQERALLSEAGSPASLAAAIARLLDDEELRAALEREARLWITRERQWKSVCAPVVRTYRDLLRAQQPPGPGLGDVRVGLIADEFTTKAIAGSVEVELLDRQRWSTQLDGLAWVIIESAWAGNGGQWHRGIGYYSKEEHSDIRALLAACRKRGIPTVFWNKEDPVHTKRFLRTARLCDHVFTVDSDLVREYHRNAPASLLTVSGMPFFAQPRIHHPLAAGADDDSIAYAGTYYGDKYPDRTRALRPLLRAADEVGLAIYDRQASSPDSPYRFPAELLSRVRGSLPYDEVVGTYRTHLAHLNVNSVPASPTMFSRRVVEIAACGGVVLSGPSRALDELFPGSFPVCATHSDALGYVHLWALDPEQRRAEAWRQMRAVLRSYTADDALVVMGRTAGIPLAARARPTYAVELGVGDGRALLGQSVLPDLVVGAPPADVRDSLRRRGVEVVAHWDDAVAKPEWIARCEPKGRTWFEDLLLAAQFGEWDRIDFVEQGLDGTRALARAGRQEPRGRQALVRCDAKRANEARIVTLAVAADESPEGKSTSGALVVSSQPMRLLIAGHDLKFIEKAIPALQDRGFVVEIDRWSDHAAHDEERSKSLVADADVVLAEWALGNAVWYGRHKRPGQRLVVRAHMQELRLPYLARAAQTPVDEFVFVNETVRRSAVLGHGVAAERSIVIPNFVDVDALSRAKLPEASRRIGLVGFVPRMKRLDRALDVIEAVLRLDPRYSLVVKGRRPEEYRWMLNRPEELAYYRRETERAESLAMQHPGAVTFEGYDENMAEWYRSVGAVLSVSDFESFHYTIADGAASGARPLVLAWGGSDLLYPADWLHSTIDSIARSAVAPWSDQQANQVRNTVAERYGMNVVTDLLARALRGSP